MYQSPEIKMYINELSKLILNTSEDCRNEFDEYIKTSINVSRIIADINNKNDYERVRKIAENEMFTKIGNQILQFIKEVNFDEYIRKIKHPHSPTFQLPQNTLPLSYDSWGA